MAEAPAVTRRDGLGLATIQARREATSAAIGAALGVSPPDGPRCVSGRDLALLGVGPGSWLALAEDAPHGWAEGLRARLGALASVSDQSGGYVVVRLSGPSARTVIQRGASIDLHPLAFPPGSVATTVIAHIGVVIRQVDERPSYDIAVARSFGASFDRWLEAMLAVLATE